MDEIKQAAGVATVNLGELLNPTIAETSSVQATLNERGDRYGDFTGHAAIVQNLMSAMMGAVAIKMDGTRINYVFSYLDPVKKQALTVIADKIARILNGDPDYKDNWHDIQGYAKLAEDRCEEGH